MSRYRLIVWIALADFFSALALLVLGLVVNTEARANVATEQVRVERQVRDLVVALADELRRRGVEVPPPGADMAIVLPEVMLFESGEFSVSDPDRGRVVADALRAVGDRWRPSFVLVVRGHTDARPPRRGLRYASNLELARLRAAALERFMVAAGVAPPRFQIVTQGVGEYEPKVPNCRASPVRVACASPEDYRTSEELAPNRRIELRFGVFSGNTR